PARLSSCLNSAFASPSSALNSSRPCRAASASSPETSEVLKLLSRKLPSMRVPAAFAVPVTAALRRNHRHIGTRLAQCFRPAALSATKGYQETSLARIAFAGGSRVGARREVRTIQNVGVDDGVGTIGLQRRRSTLNKVLPALALVGL